MNIKRCENEDVCSLSFLKHVWFLLALIYVVCLFFFKNIKEVQNIFNFVCLIFSFLIWLLDYLEIAPDLHIMHADIPKEQRVKYNCSKTRDAFDA